MDYLIPQFHDYLNAEGAVDIAGYTFSREVILKELEKEGYKEVFDDWLEQRKEENLNRCSEILSKFGNHPRFEMLQEIHDRGAIIPFVGAGLSMPSGYPGWTRFLYQVLGETNINNHDQFNKRIENGEYE